MSAWRQARLDECCTVVGGATPSTSKPGYWEGPICWATPRDLSGLEGAYISDTPRKISQEGLSSCSAEVLPPGSVLFSSRAPIGHVAINSVPMATNQGFKSFIPKPDMVYPKFLYYWLRLNRSFLESLGNGATFKEVSKAVVSRIEIPVPPVSEQRRIAEVLDRAEALRAKRRAALAQLESLKPAIFDELFGDFSKVLSRWPTKKLGDVLDFLTSGSRGWAEHYSETGSLFVRIQNVRRDELDLRDTAFVKAPATAEAKRTRVQVGDVLLSITADLGRTAVVPDGLGEAFISQHLAILRTKALVPRFLSAYLSSPAGQRQVSGRNRQAVKAGLNFDDIRSFTVPFPPPELQRRFAVHLAEIERLEKKQGDSEVELDALFASLQHRAFRGEL